MAFFDAIACKSTDNFNRLGSTQAERYLTSNNNFFRKQMFPVCRLRLLNNARFINQKLSRTLAISQSADFPLSNVSCQYVECMYEAWLQDPKSVHISWNAYFRTGQYSRPLSNMNNASASQQAATKLTGMKLSSLPDNYARDAHKQFEIDSVGQVHYYPQINSLPLDRQIILKNIAVHLFIRSFQMRGHRWAKIDPLNQYQADLDPKKVFDLSLQLYGLSEKDLDEPFMLPASSYIGGDNLELPLREIIRRLENVYCSTMGIEFMYINNYDPCIWLRQQFESPGITEISKAKKWTALKRLVRATLIERFMNKKWSSEKRFGLEGCETVITAIKSVIDEAAALGVDTFVIGMPHRGRINILANVTRQPLEDIFSRFNIDINPSQEVMSGDVKYHLGTVTKRLNRASQKDITLILSSNPSHLEAVNPVVLGKCRARQFFTDDKLGNHTMAILLHGDAAFAAEGIVYETMDLSALPAYTTHGTVHIIINNQVQLNHINHLFFEQVPS
ncbi:hypothetical protein GJ496_008368 [Pomphorhynchus laevis]|nr:hypothetical protein GJ496_008368 [Pomphorhynchus laevis]